MAAEISGLALLIFMLPALAALLLPIVWQALKKLIKKRQGRMNVRREP